MAKKKWLHKILAILPSISLIVILLISSFEIGAYGDWNFYEKEYEKYKVADELYMEMPDIMKVTKFMMSYLRGNEKKLSIETEVEGNIQDFFNEKDRLHMADVQGLFLGGLAIRRGAILVLLFSMAALVLMKADWKRLIPQMYQRVLAVFLALTAVAGFLFSRDFNKYFVIFHHIFFNNNLWILDPAEDYMIRMLPEGFFYDMVMRIGSIFAVFLIVSFVCLDNVLHVLSKVLTIVTLPAFVTLITSAVAQAYVTVPPPFDGLATIENEPSPSTAEYAALSGTSRRLAFFILKVLLLLPLYLAFFPFLAFLALIVTFAVPAFLFFVYLTV